VLSVRLRIVDSDYPFGIFKRVFMQNKIYYFVMYVLSTAIFSSSSSCQCYFFGLVVIGLAMSMWTVLQ
jgi:hypothetical protein